MILLITFAGVFASNILGCIIFRPLKDHYRYTYLLEDAYKAIGFQSQF